MLERSRERVLSDVQLQPDPALAAAGWERRFIADAQRTAEAMELYAQLGYEVRAEALQEEELTGECEGCRSLVVMEFRTIYTRKRQSD